MSSGFLKDVSRDPSDEAPPPSAKRPVSKPHGLFDRYTATEETISLDRHVPLPRPSAPKVPTRPWCEKATNDIVPRSSKAPRRGCTWN